MARAARVDRVRSGRRSLSRLRRQSAASHAARGGAAVHELPRREPQRPRSADGQIHLHQRPARDALRHPRREGEFLPPRRARRFRKRALGPHRQGRDPRDHLASGPYPPVVRGNWILRTLLGTPAPNPPPNVPALKPKPTDAAGNARPPTMRQMMEQHRANPACASCHRYMDPIGFALEPFDAIGHWRSDDGGTPIDTRSVLYDGTAVEGPDGVRAFLLRHQEQYLRNVVENLMTYAFGRGIEYDDMPAVRRVLHETARDGYRLRSLIEAVAMSDNFRMNVTSGPEGSQRLASASAGARRQ